MTSTARQLDSECRDMPEHESLSDSSKQKHAAVIPKIKFPYLTVSFKLSLIWFEVRNMEHQVKNKDQSDGKLLSNLETYWHFCLEYGIFKI